MAGGARPDFVRPRKSCADKFRLGAKLRDATARAVAKQGSVWHRSIAASSPLDAGVAQG